MRVTRRRTWLPWGLFFVITCSASLGNTQLITRDFQFTLPLFSAESPWNQRADAAAALPGSDEQILTLYRVIMGDMSDIPAAAADGGYSSGWPFIDVPYDEYTTPIFRASSTTTDIVLCDYGGERSWPNSKFSLNPDRTVTAPTPAGTIRPNAPQGPDSDGHVVLFNPGALISHDFWQATTVRDGECQSRGA